MKSPELPRPFLDIPLAHRGLHDRERGIIENSASAFAAAIAGGYGIELDVVEAACGTAMVFHDSDLRRLTGLDGRVRDLSAAELGRITLSGSTDTIPTLAQVLDLIAGQVPVLIEMKDHDKSFATPPAGLVRSVAQALAGYTGPAAVMGFNPATVAAFAEQQPRAPWGLTSRAMGTYDTEVPLALRREMTRLRDFDALGAAFVSHDVRDLQNPAILALRAQGVPILCWTTRSPAQDAMARRVAHNVTFEGYRP